jgi:hypothetical protein
MAKIYTGNDLNLFLKISGTAYPVCHAKDTQISMASTLLETTTKGSGNARTYAYQGKYGSTMQLSGLTNTIDIANFYVIQSAIKDSTVLEFILTDGATIEYTGFVLVSDINIDTPDNAISSFSGNLQITGDLGISVTGVTPPVTVSSVLIKDQFGDTIANIPAPGTYNVVRFDTLDLRGWSNPDLVITSQEAVPV